jgi:Tol biopolymer transport system component
MRDLSRAFLCAIAIVAAWAGFVHPARGVSPSKRSSGAPQLAFVRGDRTSLGHVWRTRANGSAIRMTSGVKEDYPDWSPDGREIAFVGWNPVPPGAGAETDIFVARLDGSGRRRLTRNSAREYDPDWSPTGKRLAYSSGGPQGLDLFVIDMSGHNRRRLTRTPNRCEAQPDWSPDGRRILFRLCSTGDVYAINAGGGRERLLLRSAFSAKWAPNGRSILYSREDGIYVADSAGRQPRRVAAVYASEVTWSPDGSSIAYEGDARDGCGATQYRSQIFLLSLAPGSKPKPRACVPQSEWHPAWRPIR